MHYINYTHYIQYPPMRDHRRVHRGGLQFSAAENPLLECVDELRKHHNYHKSNTYVAVEICQST